MVKRSTLLILFILLTLGFGRSALAQERKAAISYFEGEVTILKAGKTNWIPAEKPIPTIQNAIVEGKVAGEDVRIVAQILDKIPLMNVSLFYKVSGIKSYSSVNMVLTEESVYEGIIPGVEVELPGIDFYIEAENELKAIGQYGTQDSPQKIEIEEKKTLAPPEIQNVIDLPKPRIVSWKLSPRTDFGWYNKAPDITLNIKANIKEPLLEIPLIITINGDEAARLWGGPGYTHTITNLDLLNQGRNDLKISAGFDDGEAASITIPVYFDDVDPVITDPAIDFEADFDLSPPVIQPQRCSFIYNRNEWQLQVEVEVADEGSGVKQVTANGATMDRSGDMYSVTLGGQSYEEGETIKIVAKDNVGHTSRMDLSSPPPPPPPEP